MKKPHTIDECLNAFRKYYGMDVAARLMLGWVFLRAQAHFALDAQAVGSLGGRGNKKEQRGLQTVNDTDAGFGAWVNSSQTEISERTAYRYITAAENAGITVEMSEEEAAKWTTQFIEQKTTEAGWSWKNLLGGGQQAAEPEPEIKKPKTKAQLKLEERAEAWRVHRRQIADLVYKAEFTAALAYLSEDDLEGLAEDTAQLAAAIREAQTAKANAAGKKGKR